MAVNEYVNRVETVNNEVLMDISEDTVTEDDVLKGKTFHLANGAPAVGTRSECDCGDFDILEGNLPISFKGNGNPLYDYEIKGNNNINHIDESQSTLPVSIDTYGGNAEDWEIYGNNNPVVENKTGDLPIEVSATEGNAVDWVIYGNDDVGENLLPSAVNGTYTSGRGTVTCNNGNYHFHVSEGEGSVSIFVPVPEFTLPVSVEQGGNGRICVFNSKATGSMTIVFRYNNTSITNSYAMVPANRVVTNYGTSSTARCNTIQFYAVSNITEFDIDISPCIVTDGTVPDHYIPYQKGVGERTAQLLNCATFEAGHLNTDGTIASTSGVTSVVGGNGSVELTLSTAWRGAHCDYIDVSEFEQVYFSYSGATNNNQWRFCFYDATQTFVSQETKSGLTYFSLTVPNNVKYLRIGVQLSSAITYTFTNVSLIADSTLPSTYIPYGYRIPLQIKQGATTKTTDIYIGSSPLTQGQTITKSQSNVDLELFSGDNIIDTTLVNKPDASITYNSSVLGVGERTITSFTDWESGTTTTGVAQVGKTYAECKSNTSLTTRRRSVSIIPVVSGAATLHITSGYQAADIHLDKDGLYVGNNVYYHSNNYQITISDTVKYVALVLRKSDNSEFTDADVWDVYFTYSGANAYQIPLLVTSGQQSTPHTIYIGSSPLTEGQSISKTSTGTEIALYQGENTISTTLGNKPEMRIDYESAEVGVGKRTKNIINYTDIDATEYGVHCYWENDGVHVEGIFSESTPKAPQSFRRYCYLEAGTYVLSGSTDYTTTGFHLQIGTCSDDTGSNFTILGYDNGSSYTLTLQDASYVGVRIHIGAAASGQQIDAVMPIMLRRANTTSDFIPYGYQIPIQVKQRSENLFNKDASYIASKYLNSSGEEVSGSTWGISEYIPIEGNTTYTAYNLSDGGASACWYDENKGFIGGENYGGATSKSFSLPSNAKYIRLTIRLLGSPNIDTLMLIKGNTAPEDYIPYYNIIEKDIYIGNSPLLEGQSVTKELLLEDIPTYNGETIIDTTLYNKPYSIIIPTNKAANIIKEIQKLWDAVKSINPSSQSNSIDIVKKRMKLSNNVDSPVIIENISDVKVYEEEDTQNSTNQESGDLI